MIGPTKNPLWIGKKSEVQGLFTSEFWEIYEIWRRFHLGFGSPDKAWSNLDPVLTDTVVSFEEHYQVHFSREAVMMNVFDGIIERQNAMIKQLNNLIKALGRRR